MSEKKNEKQDWKVDDCTIREKAVFPERKSYSVLAMNLETVEDVEAVILQCEAIKKKMGVPEPRWDKKRFDDYLDQAVKNEMQRY